MMLGCSRGQVWFGRPALKQMNVESLDVATTLMFLNRASGRPAEGTGRIHLKYPSVQGFGEATGVAMKLPNIFGVCVLTIT